MQFDGEAGARWAFWEIGPIAYEVSATGTDSERTSDLDASIKPIVAQIVQSAHSTPAAGVPTS